MSEEDEWICLFSFRKIWGLIILSHCSSHSVNPLEENHNHGLLAWTTMGFNTLWNPAAIPTPGLWSTLSCRPKRPPTWLPCRGDAVADDNRLGDWEIKGELGVELSAPVSVRRCSSLCLCCCSIWHTIACCSWRRRRALQVNWSVIRAKSKQTKLPFQWSRRPAAAFESKERERAINCREACNQLNGGEKDLELQNHHFALNTVRLEEFETSCSRCTATNLKIHIFTCFCNRTKVRNLQSPYCDNYSTSQSNRKQTGFYN